jgi:hypothetical protein
MSFHYEPLPHYEAHSSTSAARRHRRRALAPPHRSSAAPAFRAPRRSRHRRTPTAPRRPAAPAHPPARARHAQLCCPARSGSADARPAFLLLVASSITIALSLLGISLRVHVTESGGLHARRSHTDLAPHVLLTKLCLLLSCGCRCCRCSSGPIRALTCSCSIHAAVAATTCVKSRKARRSRHTQCCPGAISCHPRPHLRAAPRTRTLSVLSPPRSARGRGGATRGRDDAGTGGGDATASAGGACAPTPPVDGGRQARRSQGTFPV